MSTGCSNHWLDARAIRRKGANGGWQLGWRLTALQTIENLRIRGGASRWRTDEPVTDDWLLALEKAAQVNQVVDVWYDAEVTESDFPIRMTVGVNGPGPYEVLMESCDKLIDTLTDLLPV